ncbi:MAG: riboflavin biosynthesis protein RibF [Synergistaceae bacterium]|nr:riboflavin biosynthesis protein RibF [Synergistaceae bacterium]
MIITIGAFDGFHRGHEKLLEVCRENSINNDWGVVTFYPHPSQFMNKFKHSLFTLEERELIRKFLGIPNFLVLKFDETFKNLTPDEFWQLLNSKIKIDGLVMGSDFKFGHERAGDSKYLENLAISKGIDRNRIFIVDVLNKSDFSSSNIRKKISNGNIDEANEILGYNWFILGKIVHGNQRGRTMNFPTANIKVPENKIIPSDGVYSVAVSIEGKNFCGALSIGNNPTFHDVDETRIEVFIMDFHEDIYGDEILVFFLDRIRDIKVFPDKESLMQQIKIDTEKCKRSYEDKINYVNRFTLSYKF